MFVHNSILAQTNLTPGLIGVMIGLAIGAAVALLLARLLGTQTLGQARKQADDLLEKARSDAENLKKKLELDARDEMASKRDAFEKEVEGMRTEIKEQERRVTKREDNLDRKLDTLTTKEKYLDDLDAKIKDREAKVDEREGELDDLIEQNKLLLEEARKEQKQTLLRLSNLSEDDARKEALKIVEHESQHEAAQIIQRNMEKADEESKDNALKITLQAIQRYASEHTADSTVSAIAIPSDDMKGRVIGREGRNIRAFEKATGVDVIVDDTPGVVVVSCFDPVRRAIAAEALHKLLEDGRIHPTRIEEIVEQIRKEIGQRIIKFGRDACIEANIQGLHPKISEMVGRLHYRMSYGQNILRHSIETAYLCQVIANELGLDGDLARRAGFLHDIGKAMDHDIEGGHPAIGMEFCKKHGEKEAVLNAIGGHHNDIPSTTPYTPIVMAADAISGARPGARRETLEKYVRRLEQLEGIARNIKGVREAYAIQAGREVRVVVDPESVDDANCMYVARDIAKQVSEEMTFPGEIKVTVLREMRTIEYAR
ncbi:ribonuclease Y [Phycisphaerales bacterium AB-hyl4]|uniref:Ribonuclease Y n=1 Tax=Natronomicrosphaera hydrolytica TaxID=3242702 RepID=A0ABV4U269_9BACT